MTTIMDMIQARYPAPKYALLREVASAGGFGPKRYCDAIVFSIWPSLGYKVDGFEVKASRADWLREMQDPDKAETFIAYCDRWWVVAPKGIVKLEELPASWGLMEPAGSALRVRKAAEVTPKKPPSSAFMASCMRRAYEVNPAKEAIEQAQREGYAAGVSEGIRRAGAGASNTKAQVEAYQRDIREFEEASGISIKNYQGNRIGAAVRMVLDIGLGRMRSGLVGAVGNSRRLLTDAEAALDAFDASVKNQDTNQEGAR